MLPLSLFYLCHTIRQTFSASFFFLLSFLFLFLFLLLFLFYFVYHSHSCLYLFSLEVCRYVECTERNLSLFSPSDADESNKTKSPRYRYMKRNLDIFYMLGDFVKAIHNANVDEAEVCTLLTVNSRVFIYSFVTIVF